MMDLDDQPKPGSILDQLEAEDLSTQSVEELEDRIKRLKKEIARSETDRDAKTASKTAADAVFKGTGLE